MIAFSIEDEEKAIAETGINPNDIVREGNTEFLSKEELSFEFNHYYARRTVVTFTTCEEYKPRLKYLYDTCRRLLKEAGKEGIVTDVMIYGALSGGKKWPEAYQMMTLDSVYGYHVDSVKDIAWFTLEQSNYHSPKIRMWTKLFESSGIKFTYVTYPRYRNDNEKDDKKRI